MPKSSIFGSMTKEEGGANISRLRTATEPTNEPRIEGHFDSVGLSIDPFSDDL
jgi:hypothetical protein